MHTETLKPPRATQAAAPSNDALTPNEGAKRRPKIGEVASRGDEWLQYRAARDSGDSFKKVES